MDNDSKGPMFGKLRLEMGSVMNEHLSVYREESGMRIAGEKIQQLKKDYMNVYVPDKGKVFNTNLIFTLELGFMLDCAETIVTGALERRESRGAHTRTDMPDRDDKNWLKHILVKHSNNGPIVEHTPVVITKWQPEIRSY